MTTTRSKTDSTRNTTDTPKIFRVTLEVSNLEEATAFEDLDAVHERATALKALAPFKVHGQAAGEPIKRPWGERSFYVTDPWGNETCFVEDGTLYT